MWRAWRAASIGFVLVVPAARALAHAPKAPSEEHDYLHKMQSWFVPGALAREPRIVDCMLSGGTKTRCVSLTTNVDPVGFPQGPWCPRNITDGPENSGIWLHAGKVYAADGPFVANLKLLYKDDRWQLYDTSTGKVRVTDSKEACFAAARPDVDPKYRNFCVECQASFLKPGTTITYVIPLKPVLAARPIRNPRQTGYGISLNGPRFDGPAPLHAILDAHTLAPFDKCGGHVNPHTGYHIHAVTDCQTTVAVEADHAPMIGLAMDGHLMFARLDPKGQEPADLDSCRGHASAGLGYHYHVAEAGKNEILGCLKGEVGCALDSSDQICDARPGVIQRIRNWFGKK